MSIICIEHVPPGSQIGLNLHTWQSGPNFRGLRDIPDGIYCLHVSIHGFEATKTAVWLELRSPKDYAFKWDAETTTLKCIEEGYVRTVNAMFLIEHTGDEDQEWSRIATYIDRSAIDRIMKFGSIFVSDTGSNVEQRTDTKHLPRVEEDIEGEFSFTAIDLKHSWPVGSVGRTVTEMSQDKSWLLTDIIRKLGSPGELLAEMVICALNVLMAASIASFEQWHVILRLICGSKTCIPKFEAFYVSVLKSIYAFLQVLSSDLYDDIFNLVLPRQLQILQQSLTEIKAGDEVLEELELVLDYLHHSFNVEDEHIHLQSVYPGDLQEESEDEEDKPVVVDLG